MEVITRWSWTLGLLGVSLLLGGLATYAVGDPADTSWMFAVAGAVSLIGYGVLDRQQLGHTVSSRSFQYGSGSSVLVMLAAALAGVLYLLAERNDHTWDLTADREFTLSDHAVGVLEAMEEEVTVVAFFRNGSPQEMVFRRMIGRMQERTSHLVVEYVDPLRQPRRAEQHQITGDQGTVILRAGEQERRLEWEITETELVDALVNLLAREQHRICWSVGHGEPDPDDEFNERGLGVAVLELEGGNYQVTRSAIATSGVDAGCEALVIARPKTDFFPSELEALAAYLASGGGALVMLEPGLSPSLAEELLRYGVEVREDVVLDMNLSNQMMGVDDPAFVVLSGQNILGHPITESWSAGAAVLPIARSVSAARGRAGLRVQEVLRTSSEAWGESNPDAPEVQPDLDELVGEVPVMVVVEIDDPSVIEVAESTIHAPYAPDPAPTLLGEGGEPARVQERAPEVPNMAADPGQGVPSDFAPAPGGRLVVIGDSDFAGNKFLVWGNNLDLFSNSIAWLVDEEDQLGERPEHGDTLEISAVGEAMLCLVSIFVVPGLAMGLALLTLLRRRVL